MPQVILYIATSNDGLIADKDGGVDWLPQTADPADEVGYKALLTRITTIIMGRTSYEQILGFGDWAWTDKKTYVFSEKPLKQGHDSISFVNEDVTTFMHNFAKNHPNDAVWLLGGAHLARSFAQAKLIDELIITIVPTVLGEGIKLELPYEDFTLVAEKTCLEDIVQRKYLLKK